MRPISKLTLLALVALSIVGASAPNASAATPSVRVALDYACALSEAGNVYCWGKNFRGQLGNGTYTDSATPVAVSDVSNAIQLDVGMYGACALIAGGTVKCWGSNQYGGLGTGGGASVNGKAVTVAGVSGATDISVGEATICAITNPGGAIKCWGYGSDGELGIPAPPSSTPEIQTPIASGATDLGLGDFHVCAVVNGGMKCWGNNGAREFVDSATTQFDTPQNVVGLTSGVAQAMAGIDISCAILVTGAVKCQGANYQGQNGTGAIGGSSTSPQSSLITSGATSLGYGSTGVCALVGDAARCWGYNGHGQLGDGTTTNSGTPHAPLGLESGVTSIDAGGENACAIVNKVVRCWGETGGGALGNGTSVNHNTPIDVVGLTGATEVRVGMAHTCAIATTLKCWGSNGQGQLGTGNTTPSLTPVAASVFPNSVSEVAVNRNSTCGVFSGAVRCVGYNLDGQLGNNSTTSSTTDVATSFLTAASATTRLEGIENSFCAIPTAGANDGHVMCWGDNGYSLLGQGAGQTEAVLDNLDEPTTVSTITANAVSVGMNRTHACAVVSAALKCWGQNFAGSVTGATTNGEFPAVQTPVASGVAANAYAVAANYGSTCAIFLSPLGQVKCFGQGVNGSLGNGSQSNSATPVNVTGVVGASAIAGSDNTYCAIVPNAVKCWGYGASGELGNGTNANASTAVTVAGLTNATSISGQDASFCARRSTGVVSCWGNGEAGQLGNGVSRFSVAPVNVSGLALFNPPPPPAYVKQKIKATLKINGKIKKSGKKQIKVPLKLYYAVPAGSSAATVCTGKPTISVKTSKKKTTKFKVKFKRKGANCSYSGTIKLPKSFKGKKTKFTVSIPSNADILSYKSTKTLKLK
jgi:alpha-tubulin suppressor-like RCC1 family protein